MIAKRIGVGGEELARIRIAAALHEVGKLETPTAVLHKPGRLTDSEFAIVKEHPVTGAQMVSILEDPELESIVRHHHERLDGTGYPDRLARDQIPLGARIISVADTFDAITSARPYRAARPHREALKILRAEAGTQLDGDAVNAFCSVYSGRRPLSAWVAFTDLGEAAAGVVRTRTAGFDRARGSAGGERGGRRRWRGSAAGGRPLDCRGFPHRRRRADGRRRGDARGRICRGAARGRERNVRRPVELPSGHRSRAPQRE